MRCATPHRGQGNLHMPDAALSLAGAEEMRMFCDAQRAFVNAGENEADLFESAARLGEHAHVRGALADDLLRAMRLAGCIRSDDVAASDWLRGWRYRIVLGAILQSYFGRDVAMASGETRSLDSSDDREPTFTR